MCMASEWVVKSGRVRQNEPMGDFSEHAIIWHLYPLGALGAPKVNPAFSGEGDTTPGRTLADLVPWLDHARKLGANVLQLGPIFEAYSHGYDTLNYFKIDPRLGDIDDFHTLIDAAHQRGFSVIGDGVFNHVSPACPQMQDLAKRGQQSAYANAFRIDWRGWQPGHLPNYKTFEGHAGLAALNHSDPTVLALVKNVMDYWLGKGLDGWRLDAAYAIDPALWAQVLPPLRKKYPHLWVSGEVIHGNYTQLLEAAGWDSLTQYELWKSIWSSLEQKNFYELQWNLRRHLEFCEHFWPQTFLGNHDVTRIASRLSPAQVGQAAAILFTLPGIPSIYSGDECGARGVKEERLGGDDAIRPPLPAFQGPQNRGEKQFWHYYASLIALRRRHSWLAHANVEITHLENEVIAYRAFAREGDGQLLVVLNNSEKPLPTSHSALAGAGEQLLADAFHNGELAAGAFGIFALNHETMGP